MVGEEGTHINDFIVYLKSEFLDYVYLQQNTFDEVDGATSLERQKYVFDILLTILGTSFKFEDKDEARSWFNKSRQLFIDYNYSEWNSDEFRKLELQIKSAVEDKGVGLSAEVESLLKEGN